ncbi:hypothetical protein JRG66_11800 [Salinimicrobium tongyeongense]|uniref:TupA-like ATPgrasp n=1 Tax=Salinimicrobium tongyeongense TaxID=2809707 RepID=A0ABY6NP16_9FLAO|nr:ATP-grasp fold amidoligase family protein [Salinimicrobium tongyeongense]UZH54649.1 hypothetical protein JRG66_11800 [Salinimicrobium tongyeongense]
MIDKDSLKGRIYHFSKNKITDETFHKLAHYYLHLKNGVIPKKINSRRPKTFNEKIIFRKLNNRFERGHLLADKYEAKNIVSNLIGPEYIIPTLAIYEKVSDIDYNSLPNSFVIKANQGSGWNIIVEDKNFLNKKLVEDKFSRWLKMDYSIYGREWQYQKISRKIIVEKFLENNLEKPLLDYKFFCFNGQPQFVQVDIDRHTDHRRNFYDLEWNLQPFSLLYPNSTKKIEKPARFQKMISIASEIARNLKNEMDFVRVDLYSHNGNIYFGEITFHPEGGCGPFNPPEYDYKLGTLLK